MAAPTTLLGWISEAIGWLYFISWSVSFYPQVWDNYKRKSVVGLSFDFLTLNILGHSCYLVFNTVYYMGILRDGSSSVHANDVVFSLHAVALTLITIFQCFIYERAKQRVNPLTHLFIAGVLIALAILVILSYTHVVEWTTFVSSLGYVKLACSFIKYFPQAVLNCIRRSTIGWSIGQILLDFSGGSLSIGQMVLDSIEDGYWTRFYENPVKMGLGVLSIVYDLIFIFQHYVLFRKNNREYWRKFREEQLQMKAVQSPVISEATSLLYQNATSAPISPIEEGSVQRLESDPGARRPDDLERADKELLFQKGLEQQQPQYYQTKN